VDTHADDAGERLAAFESRLRLLFAHLAGRAVRARVEPEDLLQEVYLRALTAPAGLPPREEGEAPLWRFLVRLSRNTVVDVARALRARKRDGDVLPLRRSEWSRAGGPRESQLLSRTAGPATRVQAAETSRRLRERFEGLSAEHRRVLGLRQFEGLSARETAERLGRSEVAVHSLYRRALAAWRDGLQEKPAALDESRARSRPPSA